MDCIYISRVGYHDLCTGPGHKVISWFQIPRTLAEVIDKITFQWKIYVC